MSGHEVDNIRSDVPCGDEKVSFVLSVFVVDDASGEPRARERTIRSGRNDGDLVEILDGANAGERIVIDGHFALGDGALVLIDDDTE